jgi:hypothetical protein
MAFEESGSDINLYAGWEIYRVMVKFKKS